MKRFFLIFLALMIPFSLVGCRRRSLGAVDVPSDAEGCLQDSHWSGGMIGYFPSYALGSAYGAQFLRKMKKSVDVDDCIAKGDFAPINSWNEEHIWRHGCLRKPTELFEAATEEKFDPNVFCDYLETKFGEIYNI